MSTRFYAHFLSTSGRWWPRLAALAAGLLLAPAAWAQIEVPTGNPNGGAGRKPLATLFGYERSALIYTAAEIGTSSSLTQIAFYLNAVNRPGNAPIKVYLKMISNASFTAPTTVAAEEAGATLVYDATIPAASFTANTWVPLQLTAPFAYDGASNLEVIVETNATGGGNEDAASKVFRYASTGSNRAQFWQADNAAPTGVGTLLSTRPNIQLTGPVSGTCAPVTALSVSNIATTSAQLAFTPGASNTSYTVTYTPAGGMPTMVTPAPTASPVNLTGLAEGTDYRITVVSTCADGTNSPVAIGSFTTLLSNDDCAGATVLATTATCTPTITTNRGATASTGVPAPKTIALGGCFPSGLLVTDDVWYRIIVPSSGGVTVTTSAVAGSVVTNTNLMLYTGTCGALTEVACSDDEGEEDFSLARVFGLAPGSTVYARVCNYGSRGPFGICAVPVPTNDAAVQVIYGLGKTPVGVAQVVRAVVTNIGASVITNLPVRLEVTGGTTFTDLQTVATLAPGASATVSFAPYTSTAIGNNTLTVRTLSADDVTTNDSQTYTQLVTANTFSYANNSVPNPNQSVGFGLTGAFAVRYTTSVARSLTGITVALADNNTVGQTIYGVVLNSSGAVVARTPDYVVTAADINQRKTFPLAAPLALAVGDFYVGLVQTRNAAGLRYFPLSTLPEIPTRPNTYFTATPFSPTTGGTLTDAAPNNWGVLMVEAETSIVLASNSAALSKAITLFPNPSAGRVTLEIREAKAAGALQVQVSNLLGQIVHTATVRDNAQNQLDLSGLAEGVYLLRVNAGAAYTMRQLVLAK